MIMPTQTSQNHVRSPVLDADPASTTILTLETVSTVLKAQQDLIVRNVKLALRQSQALR